MNEDIIQNIDNKVNKILNGTEDLHRFNQSEHAGVCSAGPLLIGALFVCDIARESIKASENAGNSQTPAANWEIDERQEQYVQRWAEKKRCWIPEAEAWLQDIMRVIGFTRDEDGLFRVILTQPYIECMRLATKEEIDDMVAEKGFKNNGDSTGVNYISEHIRLEDMHPANVFVESLTGKPICIDCIVKFNR